MTRPTGFIGYPTLTHYGDGGFRFAGERHEGSALVVNGVLSAWPVRALGEAGEDAFAAILEADPKPELLLLGVGPETRAPSPELRAKFRAAGIGLEVMTTPSAARVYHTLVGEGRRIAAALIAV